LRRQRFGRGSRSALADPVLLLEWQLGRTLRDLFALIDDVRERCSALGGSRISDAMCCST
jgi:hypothetical protein